MSHYFFSGRRYVWVSSSNDAAVVLYSDRAMNFSGVEEIAPGTDRRIARFLDPETAASVVAEFSARVELAGGRVAF